MGAMPKLAGGERRHAGLWVLPGAGALRRGMAALRLAMPPNHGFGHATQPRVGYATQPQAGYAMRSRLAHAGG